MADPGIVRNRLKIESSVTNARAFLDVQKECGSFDRYVWSFVGGKPMRNRWRSLSRSAGAHAGVRRVVARPASAAASASSARRSCYAFMQATGLVNDHLVACPRWKGVQDSPDSVSRGADPVNSLRSRPGSSVDRAVPS